MPLSRVTRHGLWLLVAGVSLGWLIGMSNSPVIQGVITALVTFVVGVAGVVVGLRSSQSAPAGGGPLGAVEPSLMTSLVLGLALGAALGIYTRTHNWLGVDSPIPVAVTGKEQSETAQSKQKRGVLFAEVPPSECEQFKAAPEDQLEKVMSRSTNPHVREFARKCSGQPKYLKAAVEELLCPEPAR